MKVQVYTTLRKFNKISKGKKVIEFPNPLVKEIDGIRYNIVPKDIVCKAELMKPESYEWYLGMSYDQYKELIKKEFDDDDPRVYVLSVSTGFFPTELVAGVKDRVFSSYTALSKKTGYINRAFLGSAGNAFRASCIQATLKILKKNHFKFEIPEE